MAVIGWKTRDVSLIKARASHSKYFTSLFALSIRPIYGIPADRSFEERSSATVDAIAPSNFPDFSCTNFRSEKRMRDEETRKRSMLSGREEGTASPSTACSRIHACTYQYRPCMTRRLTGHADKNEKKLLAHSNRAILRSRPDTQTIAQYRFCFLYRSESTIYFKEVMTFTNSILS